jgi:hypothetical protein
VKSTCRLVAIATLVLLRAAVAAGQCPTCTRGYSPPTPTLAHSDTLGTGYPVSLDPSLSQTMSDGRSAAQAAAAAMSDWNNATDPDGNTINNPLVDVNDPAWGGTVQPMIVISIGTCPHFACSFTGSDGVRYISLDPRNFSLSGMRPQDIQGRIGHEFGHFLGMNDNWACMTRSSIIGVTRDTDGRRDESMVASGLGTVQLGANAPQPIDVQTVNTATFSPGSCTGDPAHESQEEVVTDAGGGDGSGWGGPGSGSGDNSCDQGADLATYSQDFCFQVCLGLMGDGGIGDGLDECLGALYSDVCFYLYGSCTGGYSNVLPKSSASEAPENSVKAQAVQALAFDLDGRGSMLQELSLAFAPKPGALPPFAPSARTAPEVWWLVLDRDGKGRIDTDALFTTRSAQPTSPKPGGFSALAAYDRPEAGGNADGQIDASDAIFSQLRLWKDDNHDGVAQQSELRTLDQLGVTVIHVSSVFGMTPNGKDTSTPCAMIDIRQPVASGARQAPVVSSLACAVDLPAAVPAGGGPKRDR